MGQMSKPILMTAIAATMFCVTGCSKEIEYETYVREANKNVPEIFAKPMIENAMEKFRAMSADEQKKALEEIKAKLAK